MTTQNSSDEVRILKYIGISSAIIAVIIGLYIVLRKPADNTQWNSRDDQIADLDKNMKVLADQIKAAAGSLKCSASDQCQVIGLGQSHCGGYNDFLVYSLSDVDPEELKGIVRNFNALAEKKADLSLAATKCGTQPNTPRCIKNFCQVEE